MGIEREDSKYKICCDAYSPIDKQLVIEVMATADDWEIANELLKYYESMYTETEFYIIKKEDNE